MIACGQLQTLPAASPGLQPDCFIGTELEDLSGLLVGILGFKWSEGGSPSLDERVNDLFEEYGEKTIRRFTPLNTVAFYQ